MVETSSHTRRTGFDPLAKEIRTNLSANQILWPLYLPLSFITVLDSFNVFALLDVGARTTFAIILVWLLIFWVAIFFERRLLITIGQCLTFWALSAQCVILAVFYILPILLFLQANVFFQIGVYGFTFFFIVLDSFYYAWNRESYEKFFSDLERKNISIWRYRLERHELVYPHDVLYYVRGASFHRPSKYSILAFCFTVISLFIFVRYVIIPYCIIYWSVFGWTLFYYINLIFYHLCSQTSKVITVETAWLNSMFLTFSRGLQLVLYDLPQLKAFLLVYTLNSPREKRKDLLLVFKRALFSRVLFAPFWVLNLGVFLWSWANASIKSVNWSKKAFVAWPYIFMYSLWLEFPLQLNFKYSFFLYFLDKRSLIITEHVRTNSLQDKIASNFLIYQLLQSPEFLEYTSKVVLVDHRVAPYGSFYLTDPAKFFLFQSYTSQPSIRVTSPLVFQSLEAANRDVISHVIRFPTSATSQKTQFSFVTALPPRTVTEASLTNFFIKHQIHNKVQYQMFKICENAILVQNALTFQETLENIILAQDRSAATPVTYNFLKKKNLIDKKSLEFVEVTAPELCAELRVFISDFLSANQITLIDKETLYSEVLNRLSLWAFQPKLRNEFFLDTLENYDLEPSLKNQIRDHVLSLTRDL